MLRSPDALFGSVVLTLASALVALGCGPADDLAEAGEDAAARDMAINGGIVTDEHPAIGGFFTTEPGGGYCTATLVSPRAILTARHCIDGTYPFESGAFTGLFVPGIVNGVVESRQFAEKKLSTLVGDWNDLALVRLEQPIDVRSITPLSVGRSNPAMYEGVATYGRGCDQVNPQNDNLKQVMFWQWGNAWNFGCPGDSGGPTLRGNDDIVAVTSGYHLLDGNKWFVFASPTDNFSWIQDTVRQWETAPSAQYFQDVPPNHYFYPDIQLLFGSGITTGCDSGSGPRLYCPDQKVTKAQMAAFIGRATHDPSYTPPPAQGNVFVDVPANAWHAPWVEQLYDEGLVTGLDIGGGAKVYSPDMTVTRALMTVYLVRVRHGAGFVPPPIAASAFIDVPPNAWHARWIEQARKDGVVLGAWKNGAWYFEPDREVSRAEMAAFLKRLFDLPFRRREF